MALTVKQEKFCQAYVETGNASEAYRMAYATDKMKATSINSKAYELLNNGEVTVRVAHKSTGQSTTLPFLIYLKS